MCLPSWLTAMPSDPIVRCVGLPPGSRFVSGRPSTFGRKCLSAFVDGWSCSRRRLFPLSRSTTMMPFGPSPDESVM